MRIRTGANLPKVRKNNYESILGTIYQQGPVLRSEIARQLAVTLPTVTTTIKPLLEEGVLKETSAPTDEDGPVALGRRAYAVDFQEDAGYAVGIEWNPVGIIVCVTDLRGRVIASERFSVGERNSYALHTPYRQMLEPTAAYVEQVLAGSGISRDRIVGVGFATPGMVEPESGMLVRSSMSGYAWNHEAVRDDLERVLGLPVCIENHVRVRAIGQDMFQRAKRPDVYLYYFAQMGISCCVMADGEPFGRGRYGTGDIGHMVVDRHGPLCSCGRRGCLQAVCGEDAVRTKAAKLLASGGSEILRKICGNERKPEIDEIVRAVDAGDVELEDALMPAIRHMGDSIGNIVNLLNCRLVVVDYALYNSRILQRRLADVVRENNIFPEDVKVEMEYIHANRYTGAQGACALAIKEFVIHNEER